jgi:hypothetical protein
MIVPMRFAILGNHPDGWRLAEALRESGRHEFVAHAGLRPSDEITANWTNIRLGADFEDVLADPQIETAIVASPISSRLDNLRRVLQSERPAFCVHPVDTKPDGGHEIHMLQGDVHQVVVPILPLWFAPILADAQKQFAGLPLETVLDLEIRCPSAALIEDPIRPSFPGWTILRRIGGEIAEVSAFAAKEDLSPGDAAMAFGVFQTGRLFRTLWLPDPKHANFQLLFRDSLATSDSIEVQVDSKAWQDLIQRFETSLERLKSAPRAAPGAGLSLNLRDDLSWYDEVRALELNDAARRSIERRRSYTLEFQEATEDTGFKGTMTLVGCALLWLAPAVLLLSAWIPWLAWLIAPVLLVFLALQFLKRPDSGKGS